ncbi:MAG: autotransporter-associated beta strand repeat-containing protein, partial [Dolichospermum sp.]
GSNSSAGGVGDLALSGVISGTSTSFTKIGAGILTLSGTNSMTGSWLVNEGTLSVSSFGNNTNSQPITLGASSTSGKLLYRSTGAGGTTTTVLTVAAGGGSIEHNSTSGLTFSQNATLNGTLTTNCSALAGNLTFSGVLSGNGGLTVNSTNTGETILSGANTYIGTTTITAGTLRLNAADRISNSSNLVLGGGTFSTGATTGNSETVGTLQLTGDATIALGTGSHTINFSASNSTAWTAGKTLTITGWTGTASGGTAGRIYFGSSGSGLTQSQLDAINFTGQQPGAQIISGTGEIVPNFTVTITSSQSGDWNSTSTWVGGVVPATIDNVVIAAGHTVNVTADA